MSGNEMVGLNEIEKALLNVDLVHDLTGMDWGDGEVRVTLAPCSERGTGRGVKAFRFRNASLTYEESIDPGEDVSRSYPQHIIGLESRSLGDGVFEFSITTEDVEFGFKGRWPEEVPPTSRR